MKEPRRLLEAGADDFERELLASSAEDVPNARAYQRTVASLGVGLMVPLAAASVAQGASAATPVAKLGASVLAKWLASGALLGVITASGAQLVSRGISQRSAPAAAPKVELGASPAVATSQPTRGGAPALTPAPELPRSVESKPAQRAHPLPEPALVAPQPEVTPAPSAEAEPSPRPVTASLTRELDALEAARYALGSGDARAALARLERYASDFPNGVLLPEARVLEVSALIQSGQRARALELGRRIVERDPAGPHAQAVRTRLPELDKP